MHKTRHFPDWSAVWMWSVLSHNWLSVSRMFFLICHHCFNTTPVPRNHPAGRRTGLSAIFICMSGANRWWMSEPLVAYCHQGQGQCEGEMERSMLGCLLLKLSWLVSSVNADTLKQGNSSPGYDEFIYVYMRKIAPQTNFTHVLPLMAFLKDHFFKKMIFPPHY